MNKLGLFFLDLSSLTLFFGGMLFVANKQYLILLCIILLSLVSIFFFLTLTTRNELEDLNEHKFDTIKANDKYAFFPLTSIIIPYACNDLNISSPGWLAFISISAIILYAYSNITIYNFLFLLIKYHYYEVSINGKEYILLSHKKCLLPSHKIKVSQLSSTLLIERYNKK